MKDTFVEHRVFRTWEQTAPSGATRSGRLIIQYLANRYIRVWYVWIFIVLGLFGAALGLFLLSLESADLPMGADPGIIQEGPLAFIGIAMAMFTLLVAAPSIAEDIRFNAQLFYFSRPLRVSEYLLAKMTFNFLGIAIVGLIPILILSITTLAIGPGSEDAIRAALQERGYYDSQDIERVLADWRAEGVDSWADAFFVAFMPLLAVITFSIGLVGVTMAMSSFTRRAWHAAVGTVVLLVSWAILGANGTAHIRGSSRLLSHPFGWLEATVFLPFEARFLPADCSDPDPERRFGYCDYLLARTRDADTTVALAHVLFVALGVLGFFVTWLRLRRVEGAA